MKREIHTIDATGKVLGRLASEVAQLLRGKQKPDFMPHKDDGALVVIKNVEKIKISGRKIEQKKYYHHTGYLGHLRETPLKRLWPSDQKKVFQKAVFGMLPKNRLRAKMIKRLKFE